MQWWPIPKKAKRDLAIWFGAAAVALLLHTVFTGRGSGNLGDFFLAAAPSLVFIGIALSVAEVLDETRS